MTTLHKSELVYGCSVTEFEERIEPFLASRGFRLREPVSSGPRLRGMLLEIADQKKDNVYVGSYVDSTYLTPQTGGLRVIVVDIRAGTRLLEELDNYLTQEAKSPGHF